MFPALAILTAVSIVLAVRHEPHVKAWALHPRTPQRIASALVTTVAVTWQAAYMAVAVSLGGVGLAFLIATAGGVA
jgi:hypothetical protein